MDIKKYIESGILELFVLGQLSPEEENEVQAMQSKYIEIQREIHEISMGLEKYGKLKAIKAPPSVSKQLFENLPLKMFEQNSDSDMGNNLKSTSKSRWNLMSTLFALISLLGFSLFYIQKTENERQKQNYESTLRACDSLSKAQQNEFAIINQINRPHNKIIDLIATPAYEGISVYLHYNDVDKKNFLQLVNLPDITSDQVFQLWSLKAGSDPMPLDVFSDRNKIIPVAYIENTATYAITIEPKGGSKTPSMDKLIGTLGII
ncbi:MAG: anti-sigma factor [Saprospiraceae bacterium]|nr:anti-sigma factor [Saprospiraceae bacterium]